MTDQQRTEATAIAGSPSSSARPVRGRAGVHAGNAVSNDGPELLDPVPVEQLHGVLDPETGELIGAADAPLF